MLNIFLPREPNLHSPPPPQNALSVWYITTSSKICRPCRRAGLLAAAAGVHVKLFDRVAQCITSPNAHVARQAIIMSGSMCVLHLYIMRFPEVIATIKGSLANNRAEHWNPMIRQMSSELFDRMYDFA